MIPVDEVRDDPERRGRASAAHPGGRGCDRILVHFDVDVIDFTDVPLSENWGRNEGLAVRRTRCERSAGAARERRGWRD